MLQGDNLDWGLLLGGIAALLTAAGGVLAVVLGRQKNGHGQDKSTERTLDNVWDLVQKVQEERKEERKEAARMLAEAEDRCNVRIGILEAKVERLEAELRQAHRPQGGM